MQAMGCAVESLWYNGIASLIDFATVTPDDLFSNK